MDARTLKFGFFFFFKLLKKRFNYKVITLHYLTSKRDRHELPDAVR